MRELIFDLDDTLIASFPVYAAIHQRIARDLGWRVPSRAQLAPYLDSWEATLASLWPDRDLAPFHRRFEQIADECPYPAVPGVLGALQELRAAGRRMWIVTTRSERRLAQRMGEAQIPAEWFAGIFTREAQPAIKPDPRCFEPVWDAMGGRPEHAPLYVGDRGGDAHAAAGAGLPFVAVLTGPEAELEFFPGDVPRAAVLETAAALPGWLAGAGL